MFCALKQTNLQEEDIWARPGHRYEENVAMDLGDVGTNVEVWITEFRIRLIGDLL